MRILLLLNCSFPRAHPAGSRLEKYARGLREAGAEAFVCGVTREPREEVRDGWRLSATGVPHRVALLQGQRRGSSRAIMNQVRDAYLRAAAELGPWDAVLIYGQAFCYSNPVVEQCRQKGIRCLVECNEWLPWHGFKGFCLSPWYWDKEAFRKFTVPRASGAIAISTLWENYLRSKGVAVIRIPALGEAEGGPAPSPPAGDPFSICYVGRLARKNLPFALLESVRLARSRGLDVKLTVMGQQERSWTERRARRMLERDALLRARVELTGFIPDAELRARLAAAHALVLLRPDTRQARACFPTRLPEYLQTGRPVILSAVDDFPLYFQHKVNAWLVPPGHQPERVAEAYAELSGSPALAAAIGQGGRETGLREFSYRAHGARLLEFLEGLEPAGRRRPRPAALEPGADRRSEPCGSRSDAPAAETECGVRSSVSGAVTPHTGLRTPDSAPRTSCQTDVCWLVASLGCYHAARIGAFARRNAGRTIAVEYTDEGEFKEFRRRPGAGEAYQLHTLLPGTRRGQVYTRALVKAIRGKLSELGPGVVCLPGWSNLGAWAGLEWCLRTRTPAVVFSESTAYDQSRSAWREGIKARFVQACSAALVGGRPHSAYAEALGMPRARVFTGCDVVDNAHFAAGADAARREAAAARARLALPARYFLASGRFVPKKNLARLLEAYAHYRRAGAPGDWKLVVLGDGALRQELLKRRTELGLTEHASFPGFRGYDDLPAYYGLAAAFVHASTTEQWGLVVNEAMAAGLPVLVSERCGCAPDLVAPGRNGSTFDPFDAQALAKRLLEFAGGECDLAAMGRTSRGIIARWTPETFAAGLEQAVRVALGSPPPAPGLLGRLICKAVILARLG